MLIQNSHFNWKISFETHFGRLSRVLPAVFITVKKCLHEGQIFTVSWIFAISWIFTILWIFTISQIFTVSWIFTISWRHVAKDIHGIVHKNWVNQGIVIIFQLFAPLSNFLSKQVSTYMVGHMFTG